MTWWTPPRRMPLVVLVVLAVPAAAVGGGPGGREPPAASTPAEDLEHACDGGDAAACYAQGLRLEAAESLETAVALAWKAFHRACRMGSHAACSHALRRPPVSPAELERRCRSFGDTSYCLALALIRERGSEADRATVGELYRTSCLRGKGMGCYLLGRWTEIHAGPERRGEAVIAYRGACGREVTGGCVRLARLLLRGRGVWRDLETAHWAYQLACDNGDGVACKELRDAAMAAVREPPGDPRDASLTAKACSAGHQDACTDLAMMADVDCLRATPLLERACAAGLPRACGALGFHPACSEGRGGRRRGIRGLQLGCMGDDAESCATLAGRWSAPPPDGRQEDRVNAAILAFNACNAGLPESCGNAGTLILDGAAGKPEPELALRAFQQGCDGDDGASCVMLGRMVQGGEGIPPDEARARAAFEKACRANDQRGCAALSPAAEQN